ATILLDACVPQWLRNEFVDHTVITAQFAGVDQLSDTDLLATIEGRFDVLITLERRITHQQRLAGRTLAVIVLRVTDQTPEAFRALVPALLKACKEIKTGEVREVGP